MMSDQVEGQKAGGQAVLGGLEVTTARNYFGRQLDSFVADSVTVPALEDGARPFPAVFIRAPVVTAIHSADVEVLASVPAKPTDPERKGTMTTRPRLLELFLRWLNATLTVACGDRRVVQRWSWRCDRDDCWGRPFIQS
jgi:hypothetical protein